MFEFVKLRGGITKCVHVSSAAESYLTLCDPVDCSPPGSSLHGISQARILQWVAFLLQGIAPTQGLNQCLVHWKTDSLPLNRLGNPVLPIIKYLLVISTQSIQPRGNIETLSHSSLCEIKDRVKIENRGRACRIRMHVNHNLHVCDSFATTSPSCIRCEIVLKSFFITEL